MRLIWDDWNRNHIKTHNVTVAEVEEIYEKPLFRQETYGERIMLFGRTKKGRLITIVCSQELQTDHYVVSARDMGRKERKTLYEIEEDKTN